MNIDTILLAVGSESERRGEDMVRTAIEEAEGTDAEIVLLHVFEENRYPAIAERLNLPAATDPDLIAARVASVQRIENRLEGADLSVTVRGAVGERGQSILETADAVDADRIIVGGRKRTPIGKAVFGSTAQEVMLHAACPTTFVRA